MSFEPGGTVISGGAPALELQWVFRSLWRRRLMVASIFASVVLIVGVYTAIATPLYESTSLLLIKFGREYVYQSDVGEGGQFMPRNRETLINSEIQILRSAQVVKGVVEAMGVETLYPSLAINPPAGQPLESVAAGRFLQNLRVRAVEDADVIQVSLRNTDPQVTARAVNLLVELFKDAHLEAFGEQQSLAFLEEKATQSSEDLKRAEAKLLDFQAKHPQFSLEDKDALLLRERTDLETALRDVENQIVAARQRILTSDASIPGAQEQLLRLRLEEQGLLNTHNEESRQVANVRNEIALVEGFLAEQESSNASRQNRELSMLTSRKQKLEDRLTAVDSDLTSLPALSGRFRELKRNLETGETNYKRGAQRLETARTSAEMDKQKIANISVIQPAYAPLEPVSPRPMLNLVVAVILGGGLALGAALVSERLFPSA